MNKKTWMKVKRGLLEPKHRLEMGKNLWLYLYIIDRANWDTGSVLEWVDQYEADELEMPVDTLRYQRKKLEEAGYITAIQRKHHQEIVIHNWTDPRKYDGVVSNEKSKGSKKLSPSNSKGSNKGRNKGNNMVSEKVKTPTSNSHKSHNTNTHINKLPELVYEDIEKKKSKFTKKIKDPLVYALEAVTGIDTKIGGNFGYLAKFAKNLWQGGYSHEDIAIAFGPGGNWYKKDWRGKKKQKPSPADVTKNIKEYLDRNKGRDAEAERQKYVEGEFKDFIN